MKTEVKFKPWQVVDTYHEYIEGEPQIIIWDGDEQAHKPICDMGKIGDMTYTEELANAHLIAAAPDLFNALSGLLSFCKSHYMSNHWTEQAESALIKALNQTEG